MSDPHKPTAADHLERAWHAAEEEVKTASTAQQALERAAAFFEAVLDLRRRAAELRKQTVMRIWEEEKLSLAWLADVLGVSRPRAGQLVDKEEVAKAKAAREARKGKP